MKPYLKHALLASVLIIIWSLLTYLTGLDRSEAGEYLKWISYPIMLLFIVLAIKEEKSLNAGYIRFDAAFKTGFFMMMVVSVIMAAFTYIYFTFINTEIMEFAMEKARESMEDKGMSDDEIEQSMKYAKYFTSPGAMTAIALIGNIIVGAIFSLIVAAVMKKEKPAA